MKRVLVASVGVAMLLGAGAALGARGFSDPSGDENAAPDMTSVEISEATAGVLTIRVSIANYQTLPANSWVNVWFDVDSNPQTGDEGDETLVRFSSDRPLELFTWNGTKLVAGPTDGISGSFAAGVLTVTVPRAAINAPGAFGLLAVSSRGQGEGNDQLVASDFAPDVGRSSYTGPAAVAFPDALGDHDAAPDITAVRVSDAKNGWITFAVTTPNYATLPAESAVLLFIDADNNARTGDGGADVALTTVGGEVVLDRWSPRARDWVADDPPMRARVRNSASVVSLDLHVSELDYAPRFGFQVAALDVDTTAGEVLAADFAPDDLSYWRYTLANKPAVKLVFTRAVAQPVKPRAGKAFTVGFAVTRSDTRKGVASGTVGCHVLAHGKTVPAKGRISGGAALCSFVVPKSAQGSVLRGTVTVHSGGQSLARSFSYVVL